MSSPINPYGFAPMDRVKWFQVALLVIAGIALIISVIPMFAGRPRTPVERICSFVAPLLTIASAIISMYRASRALSSGEKS